MTYSLWCSLTNLSTITVVDDFQRAFGRRVRELRTRIDLSLEELAHRCDVHWTYLSGIERGRRNPTLINIGRLAWALQVSLAEFFSVFARRRKVTARARKKSASRS